MEHKRVGLANQFCWRRGSQGERQTGLPGPWPQSRERGWPCEYAYVHTKASVFNYMHTDQEC